MNQLKMGDILNLAAALQKEGMTVREIALLPVYIGNDDELNGIHTAWYAEPIKPEEEEYKWMVEMINEDHCNVKIEGKAILIS